MTDAELIQLRYDAMRADVRDTFSALSIMDREYDAPSDELRLWLADDSVEYAEESVVRVAVRVQYCDDAAIDRARFGTVYDVLLVSGDPLALLWAVDHEAEVEAIWRSEVLS